ncbi:hypothetical protein Poli38472_012158 [Pythium oligandrum]|uniref:Uncharacterized protein n=1 Tax=Pythium oligandrum TaxID=41045 RepID=A0A8K1CNY0_PYTOL|nr:hypothetical protein Poli38472_012158 [Pythium oligandrum]|eukprot:TMW67042.1 hypothetical protein Poli38472_012158 [Pythium oligandrum]
MKLFTPTVLAATALAVITGADAQSIVYQFDSASAAGVNGNIQVNYLKPGSSEAKISANLDFSKVQQIVLREFDGNCTKDVVSYKWHIHVKWGSKKQSDEFDQCSKALTGNHYDPTKACGANSEYAETPDCASRIKNYACNPEAYKKNPSVCEKGDLSGKFGDFKLNDQHKVTGEWTDSNYPLFSENTPQWNIVLHAACENKAAPRVACAVARTTPAPGGAAPAPGVTPKPAPGTAPAPGTNNGNNNGNVNITIITNGTASGNSTAPGNDTTGGIPADPLPEPDDDPDYDPDDEDEEGDDDDVWDEDVVEEEEGEGEGEGDDGKPEDYFEGDDEGGNTDSPPADTEAPPADNGGGQTQTESEPWTDTQAPPPVDAPPADAPPAEAKRIKIRIVTKHH